MENTKLIISEDGSHTLFVPALDEHYHSTHGALNESLFVYITHGLNYLDKNNLTILEVGMGTGLNALLTAVHGGNRQIKYLAYEKYPLPSGIWQRLNHGERLGNGADQLFRRLHDAPWGEPVMLTPTFELTKIEADFREVAIQAPVDLVYFDAFGPDKQNDLWTPAVFAKLFDAMPSGGVLVTYCAKGSVRRMLVGAGFKATRMPGPPPKREMLRAEKP